LLGQLEGGERTVIADLEAGVGTLTRMAEGALDALIVVAEPTPKSIEVARRAQAIAAERGIAPVRFIANKVRDEAEAAMVRDELGGAPAVVHDDPQVRQADRDGAAPLDHAPTSVAMVELIAVARDLVSRGA
jgi:CO dehydrogenase maturation factor